MSLFISTSEKQRKGDERQSWLTTVNTSLLVDLSPPGFHTSRAEREGGKGGDQGRGRRKKAAGRDRRRSRLERAEILRRRGRGWEERAQGWGSEERRHAGQGL